MLLVDRTPLTSKYCYDKITYEQLFAYSRAFNTVKLSYREIVDKGVKMSEISILRADFYMDGTIVPLLISLSDGSNEHITAVESIRWFNNGKECLVQCTTLTKKITLHLSNPKWEIVSVDI